MNKKYKKLALGGTFDRFHKGHESFIYNAFLISEKVLIGITSDTYLLKNKEKDFFEKFEIRKKSLISFLKKKDFFEKAEIIAINNKYGPTLRDRSIDAIFVSSKDVKIAEKINLKREKNKLKKLKIVLAAMVLAEDTQKISSKRIRNGEINRQGRVYIKKSWLKGKLLLPNDLRKELIKPFGKLFKKNFTFITKFGFATVGDITTVKANKKKKKPQIAVFDFLVKRKKTYNFAEELGFKKNEQVVKIINPPGTVTSDLFKTIINVFNENKNRLILVEGEDDLAVLPLVLCAPLNFHVYYGQPDKGVVKILVTEKTKEKAYKLASRFKKVN
jgi:pantetheine-phosphate adenylyltransferase